MYTHTVRHVYEWATVGGANSARSYDNGPSRFIDWGCETHCSPGPYWWAPCGIQELLSRSVNCHRRVQAERTPATTSRGTELLIIILVIPYSLQADITRCACTDCATLHHAPRQTLWWRDKWTRMRKIAGRGSAINYVRSYKHIYRNARLNNFYKHSCTLLM